MSRIIPRSEWGARYQGGWADSARVLPIRTSGSGRGVWLHHTVMARPGDNANFATDAAQVRAIEAVGQGRFGGGISYTAVVTPSGRIFEGHPMRRKGAHTSGHNRHGAAIVLAGDYSTRGPTQAQLDSVAWLLNEWHRLGWIDQPRLTGGHRDAPGNSTACPGNAAHRQIAEINRRATRGTPTPDPEPTVPDWQTPEHMRAVQTLLNDVTDAGLVVDGIRGDATEAATLHYQTEYRTDLDRDGSPGPATRTALQEDDMTIKELTTKVDAIPGAVSGYINPRYSNRDNHGLWRDAAGNRAALVRIEAALAELNGHEVDVEALAGLMLPIVIEAIAETNTDAQAQAIVEAIGRKLAPQED